ncbi:MAG: colicin E3/pyocin S6 family cytotoxin, partial [Pseudomonadota bacterium]|nr:colicin E3/pyocin S6 family cytotoxin [Pseudomonadota bacterium]
GWTHDTNGTRRTITWDDENRIREIKDNGHRLTYTYDAAGHRLTKRGPQGETGYINQWFTLRNGEVGTKHVYAGTTRIVSKLVKQDKPNSKRKGRIVYEKDQYTYHPDHLGTSAYITHTNGQVYQHLEYFPFGETWVEEHSNKQRTPYLFTAKELDEASQLYYFGARYYDPRTSVWQSVDPILGDYLGHDPRTLRGMGGVFVSQNLSLYSYTHQNPVKFVDPDGNEPGVPDFTIAGAATGTAVGGVIGAAGGGTLGLACGPGAPACSTAGGVGGAIAGGEAGLLVGTAIGAGFDLVEDFVFSLDQVFNQSSSNGHEGSTGPIQAPDELPAFPDAKPAKPKTPVQGGGGKRKRWKDSKGRIFEWDSQHGTVEGYDKTGKKHRGEFDPNTGEQIKPPKKGRNVEP